jgi:hypothetical protein
MSFTGEYEDYGAMVFRSESQKKHWGYYEGLEKV